MKKKINKNIAIKISGLSKRYELHHEKPTLVEKIIYRKSEKFMALNNINISIKKGERVGLIGPNGCGKTTLLKIITGITAPTKGSVQTDGKIVSLIDLEAGFHPDMTGIQNIFLNGMVLGMAKSEIQQKLDDIVNFANIGSFIDSQLFTYSQGMKLRLGFAIAVHADPNILILDENIAVGDENFNLAVNQKISELLKSRKTIVVASHNMYFIKDFCKRVIWIDKGNIKMDAAPSKVISAYLKFTIKDGAVIF